MSGTSHHQQRSSREAAKHNEQNMQHHIPPPMELTYPSQHEAEAALHAWTKEHGFNVSKEHAIHNESKVICARLFAYA